jgi:hypothetical protein
LLIYTRGARGAFGSYRRAALASVPFGFVLVRVRVRGSYRRSLDGEGRTGLRDAGLLVLSM